MVLFLSQVFMPFSVVPAHAQSIAERVSGYILLAVESHGEAWYVNPDDLNRYYLGKPENALEAMRRFGLGISNRDFDSFYGKAPKRLSGKILLKVEDKGRAYYVYPKDLKMYSLGLPAEALEVMRKLGLGISNLDLAAIEIGEDSALPPGEQSKTSGFQKFSDEKDMKIYLQSLPSSNFNFMTPLLREGLGGAEDTAKSLAPERVSDTNVQIKGIDEPDIVKTDGHNIYFSSPYYYYPSQRSMTPELPSVSSSVQQDVEVTQESIAPPEYYSPKTQIIEAFPPEALKQLGTIPGNGELLLHENVLASLTYRGIAGYDVSDPKNPKKLWEETYGDQTNFMAARLFDGKIYLILSQWLDRNYPCPIRIMESVEIACSEILYPVFPAQISQTFTVLSMDMATGAVENRLSFLAEDSYFSPIFVSENNIYISYYYPGDQLYWNIRFIEENSSLYPEWYVKKIAYVKGLDISDDAKNTEVVHLWSRLLSEKSRDEAVKFQKDINNRLAVFLETHIREIEKSHIVKIDRKTLSIAAKGEAPGRMLNQFSMDEYQGNLRVAVTITGSGSFFLPQSESKNDVYVFDENMKKVGSVTDLGLGEQIYSIRFMGDRGYMVTFRQIDPFFVLDLSIPASPKVSGELKIPGYSSLLEPVGEHLILGVGQEDFRVKLSLFDVSDPANPVEKSKYTLEESWSEVLYNHHAFLRDEKFQSFFIPAGVNGYVFGYEGGNLSLEAVAADTDALRALFINDFLYILGDDRVFVYDENTWKKVADLSFVR